MKKTVQVLLQYLLLRLGVCSESNSSCATAKKTETGDVVDIALIGETFYVRRVDSGDLCCSVAATSQFSYCVLTSLCFLLLFQFHD
jgi:hypothetical protein